MSMLCIPFSYIDKIYYKGGVCVGDRGDGVCVSGMFGQLGCVTANLCQLVGSVIPQEANMGILVSNDNGSL